MAKKQSVEPSKLARQKVIFMDYPHKYQFAFKKLTKKALTI